MRLGKTEKEYERGGDILVKKNLEGRNAGYNRSGEKKEGLQKIQGTLLKF